MAYAKSKGINLTIGSIIGRLPFQFAIDRISIEIDDSNAIYLEDISLRVSFFSLLKNTFAINYFHVKEATYLFIKPLEEVSSLPSCEFSLPTTPLPMNVSLRSLKIENLHIENISNGSVAAFGIQANGFVKENLSKFFLNLSATAQYMTDGFAELNINNNYPDDHLSANVKVKLKSTEIFNPFITVPFNGAVYLQSALSGPKESWKEVLFPCANPSSTPIKGRFKLQLFDLEVPKLTSLNHNWEIDSRFAIFPERSLDVEHLMVKSDLISLDAQGDFDSEFDLKSGNLYLCLPELALFNSNLPVPLGGKLEIEAVQDAKGAAISLEASDLKIGPQQFPSVSGMLSALREQEGWHGSAKLAAKHTTLPLNLETEFTLTDKSLLLDDFVVRGPDAQIAGNLTLGLDYLWLEGDLLAQVQQLNRFQPLFPHSRLNGNLGGSLHFSKDEGTEEQQMKLHLLLKNFQCFNLISDELSLKADLIDLFGTPYGILALDGSNTYFGKLFLSKLFFSCFGEKNIWPFELRAEGAWKDSLELQASGVCKTAKRSFSLLLEDLKGYTLKRPFQLEHPFTINWSPTQFKITECAMQIGEGGFLAAIDLTPKSAKGYMQAEHFPLDLLTLVNPSLSLNGLSSIDASFEGDEKILQGRLNLLLEEASVLQFGKKTPLPAKGALQANLDNNVLQIHSNIHAIGEQFFQGSATFPITYQLYPFRIGIDKKKPISSEVLMEGKLEDIFDFINIGSQRATGLLSAHLFLSKTLEDPALNGSLEVQNGTYENYILGSYIKDIDATIEAKTQMLTITCLNAKDKDDGTVSAQGTLLLHPSEKFPYSVKADLNNLNFLRFDSLDSNFTGPLEISGDTDEAFVEGTLVISEAKMQIPDKLLVDVPILPVTFINQPIHLGSPISNPKPSFPFHLDLNLNAEDKIFLTGRGISSEWKGRLHLTGTNMDFSANGTFTLVKGEFHLAGKVFKLTDGEITFNDKPTQTAFLNVTSTLDLSDMTVTAILRGPLTSPQLTFQSNPYMPTSSILSRILFNKDISEINPLQAIQLAQTIVTLSGGSAPDVLEAIRKSLGVDRFSIVSNADELSVQIGKYIAKGVMITLSQSATSSNVIVEVELKHGFVFQAETQQEEEGKFSLKWNRNY